VFFVFLALGSHFCYLFQEFGEWESPRDTEHDSEKPASNKRHHSQSLLIMMASSPQQLIVTYCVKRIVDQ
jgi:hypothetical protein